MFPKIKQTFFVANTVIHTSAWGFYRRRKKHACGDKLDKFKNKLNVIKHLSYTF